MKKREMKRKVGRKEYENDEEGDEEVSTSEEEEGDDMGDMVVEKFNWKEKTFKNTWTGNGTVTNDSYDLVLQDYPEEALKVIWDQHKNNMQVREWINGVGGLYVEKWLDIEDYARVRRWVGCLNVAIAAKTTITTIAGGKPVDKLVEADKVIDAAVEDKNMEKVAAGIVALSSPTKKKQDVCVGFHHWEGCNNGSYVTKGCLAGKRCHGCNAEFRGTRKPTIEEELVGGYWPSGRDVCYHCVWCKIAYCSPCKALCDQQSPAGKTKNGRKLRRTG